MFFIIFPRNWLIGKVNSWHVCHFELFVPSPFRAEFYNNQSDMSWYKMILLLGQVSSLLPCVHLNFQRHLLFWADIVSWSREKTSKFLQDWAQKRNVKLRDGDHLNGKELFSLNPRLLLLHFLFPPSICQDLHDFLHASAVCFCESNIVYLSMRFPLFFVCLNLVSGWRPRRCSLVAT